jgi:Rad3-related DNA helicase
MCDDFWKVVGSRKCLATSAGDTAVPADDQINWADAVVIFDEAHNVGGVCADSSSFDITARHLTDAMAEARRSVSYMLDPHYDVASASEVE